MLFAKSRLEKSDSIIVMACLCLAVMSSGWLFYDIIWGDSAGAGSIKIGHFAKLQNQVKRKFDQSLVWHRADANSDVFENDWIFTGSSSTVTIALDDGGEINLDPDSMIILSRKNGTLQLNLQHGSFLANVEKESTFKVIRNGQTEDISTKGGKFKVETANPLPPIAVLKGVAEVNGKKVETLASTNNPLEKEKAKEKKPVLVKSLRPSLFDSLTLQSLKEGKIDEETLLKLRRGDLSAEELSALRKKGFSNETLDLLAYGALDKDTLAALKAAGFSETTLAQLQQTQMSPEALAALKSGALDDETLAALRNGTISEEKLAELKKRGLDDQALLVLKHGALDQETLAALKAGGISDYVLASFKRGTISPPGLKALSNGVLDDQNLIALRYGTMDENTRNQLAVQGLSRSDQLVIEKGILNQEAIDALREGGISDRALVGLRGGALSKKAIAAIRKGAVKEKTLSHIMDNSLAKKDKNQLNKEGVDELDRAVIAGGFLNETAISAFRQAGISEKTLVPFRKGALSKQGLGAIGKGVLNEKNVSALRYGELDKKSSQALEKQGFDKMDQAMIESGSLNSEAIEALRVAGISENLLARLQQSLLSPAVLALFKSGAFDEETLTKLIDGTLDKETLNKLKAQGLDDKAINAIRLGALDKKALEALKEGGLSEDVLATLAQRAMAQGTLRPGEFDPRKDPLENKGDGGVISLVAPHDYEAMWYVTSMNTKFRWKADVAFDEYILELSRDKSFKSPIRRRIKQKNEVELKLPMVGQVFWRVIGRDGASETPSETSTFTAKINVPPLPVSPENESRLRYPVPRGETPLQDFVWSDQYKVWTEYDIEVSKSSDFKESLLKDFTKDTTYQVEILEDGVYYWRVRGRHTEEKQVSSWTSPQKFDLKILWPKDLPTVKLEKNKIMYWMVESDYPKVLADKTMPTKHRKTKLTIKWQGGSKADKYRVSFSRDPDFKEIYHEEETTKKVLIPDFVPIGKTYFKVQPIYKTDDFSPPATGTIVSWFPAPTASGTNQENKEYLLNWNPLPGVDSFQVKYTYFKSDKNRQNLFINDTKTTIPNQTGYLSWKVRAIDPLTKEPLSPYSKEDFWFNHGDPDKEIHLASVARESGDLSTAEGKYFPKIVRPEKRKTFILMDKADAFFVLEWEYSSKADTYDIEISRSPAMTNPVLTKSVSGKTKTVISQNLDSGIYYIRLRGKQDGYPKAWSEPQIFRVIRKKSH
ncbi:MAG: FecR domain-containing protein [Bdellovibrionales bacterium]|nr:FecR domain-containing protein [Bdellovibrionales bacterium]